MNSIPASQLVSVTPGVLSAGGNSLSLNAVMLTQDTSIPSGAVQPFANAAAVSAWFGPNAAETTLAAIYFDGFLGANTLPGTLYFAQYNTAAIGAYLRGASQAGISLTTLQSYSGTLSVTVDGVAIAAGTVNFSGATSFSQAAGLIQTALQSAGSVFTGNASQAGTVVTVSVVTTGAIHVGDVIVGTGFASGTTVISFGTGTGGAGTYNVSTTETVADTAVTVAGRATATYDALRQAFVISSESTGVASTIGYASGTLATLIGLTAATGAVTSQGAAANTPAATMGTVTKVTQNFATFMTTVEVVDSVKEQFAQWNATQPDRYVYVCQDSNPAALTASPGTTFGEYCQTNNIDGICPVYDTTGGKLAAFICGVTASIDFSQRNGRITYAYKGQSGLAPQVTDATDADNLISNHYNFYAAYATANQSFTMLQPGLTPGRWTWLDPYVNQIYLNSELQLALMQLLTQTKSVPYNAAGYGLLRTALGDPISNAVNFGSIQPGVALSQSQAAAVNSASGLSIAGTIQNQGWYLQVSPANSGTRAQRGSPPMTLWYTDGGSIQKLALASIDIQ